MADNGFAMLCVRKKPSGYFVSQHALIGKLLGSTRPSAIARFVPLVVVDSVDGHFVAKRRPHVGEEVRKRLVPSFADSNASRAIVFVRSMFRVFAAHAQSLPAGVLMARFAHGDLPKKGVSHPEGTSATGAFPAKDALCLPVSYDSARAPAFKDNLFKPSLGVIKDRPLPDGLANMIDVVVRFIRICHRSIMADKYGNCQA